jgi:hypothetical protein
VLFLLQSITENKNKENTFKNVCTGKGQLGLLCFENRAIRIYKSEYINIKENLNLSLK